MKVRSRFFLVLAVSSALLCSVLLCSVLLCSVPSPASAEKPSSDKQLYEAILMQDFPQVQSILSQGANASARENGRPLLGWAAQSGNIKIVAALLKAGANPNDADTGVGHTPLMRAIETQQVEIAKLLLKLKANPNAVAKDGKSCLSLAIESKKPEIVSALIAAGVELNTIPKENDPPALIAAQDGSSESLEILKLLAQGGADLNASNLAYTPLSYAIEQGNGDLVKTLLAIGANPNAKTQSGKYPLELALDQSALFAELLKAKANPNVSLSGDSTPLLMAVQDEKAYAVKLLLEAGADATKPDSSGRSPLDLAKQSSDPEIANLLKKHLNLDAIDVNASTPPVLAIDSSKGCSIVDAARMQMDLHGKLQKEVDAGTRSSEIFRTFNEDTKDYANLLATNPPAACQMFERLRVKYGVKEPLSAK